MDFKIYIRIALYLSHFIYFFFFVFFVLFFIKKIRREKKSFKMDDSLKLYKLKFVMSQEAPQTFVLK